MPYIITNLCTNDGACVEVCPVACIHTKPGAPQFYIDPEVCIDCEQCEIVCPVDAIFKDIDIPAAVHRLPSKSTRLSSGRTKRPSDRCHSRPLGR